MFCYRFEMINNIHTSLLSQLNIKAHNDDAYGLFRALHFHNPIQYSHIVALLYNYEF